MKGFHPKYNMILLVLSLFIGMLTILPVLANEEDLPSDPNVVRGKIVAIGRDYVQIDTTRYTLFSNIAYFNEEHRPISDGRKKMKINMKADLLVKEGIVVQVTLYGLLRR